MAKYRAVLFDLDGTLRDTKEAIYQAIEQTLAVHNETMVTREEIKPHIHHHSAVYAALSPQAEYGKWLETYRGYLGSTWMDSPFFTDAEAVLEQLSMAGYRLAVVTSAEYERTIEYLSYRSIDQFFEVVVAMREGLRPKPAPDMMQEALRQLDCTPEEAITIGDMITDAQSAQAAGTTFVGITHGFASREELLEAGADYLIDSLAEFPIFLKQR